ncbi:MAG TPA: DUF2304 domain-containing protein [Acidimicrobiia bacterium]|jgi:hypothetical protein
MQTRLEISVVLIALAFTFFVVRLVRRRQLREKYALLWMGVGATVVVLSLTRHMLDRVALALGFSYTPSILFLVAIVFLLAVAAHLSWEVSRLEEKTRRLAEEIALMRPERADPGIVAGSQPYSS